MSDLLDRKPHKDKEGFVIAIIKLCISQALYSTWTLVLSKFIERIRYGVDFRVLEFFP